MDRWLRRLMLDVGRGPRDEYQKQIRSGDLCLSLWGGRRLRSTGSLPLGPDGLPRQHRLVLLCCVQNQMSTVPEAHTDPTGSLVEPSLGIRPPAGV